MNGSKLIYVVEDDMDISEMIVLLLTDENFAIKTSANLYGFRKMIAESIPDLILMDIMLPDGNGMDECAQLKASQTTMEIPLILMSAHAQSKLVAVNCQADGFIAKPFDIYDFVGQIKARLY